MSVVAHHDSRELVAKVMCWFPGLLDHGKVWKTILDPANECESFVDFDVDHVVQSASEMTKNQCFV